MNQRCFRLWLLLFYAATPLMLGASALRGGSCSESPSPDSVSLVSISISPSNATIGLSVSQQFDALGTYSDGSSVDITSSVTWVSSDTSIATISATGVASSVAVGTSTITANMGGVTSNESSLEIRQMYAYIANESNNTVSICPVRSDATFAPCNTSSGNSTFNSPTGLSVNNDSTLIYVANFNTNSVSICSINGDGSLGSCTTSNGNSTFENPSASVLDPTNAFIYVTNVGFNDDIAICSVANDGSLSDCTLNVGDGTYTIPQDISLSETTAYVSNLADNISICQVGTDGSLDNCELSDGNGTFGTTIGVALSVEGDYLYVSNFGSGSLPSTVSICPIEGDGSLGVCTTSDGNGTFDFSAFIEAHLFMSSGNGYGYVPNCGNDTVSLCPINEDGSLGTCTALSDASFNQPSGIVLSFIQ